MSPLVVPATDAGPPIYAVALYRFPRSFARPATAEEIYDLMLGDKKILGSKIGFILTRGIGQAFQTTKVEEAEVIKIVHDSLKGF